MNEKESENLSVPEDTGSEDRLVPVSEAIKYRKRAQAAEKELSEIKSERDALVSEKAAADSQLAELKQDQQIRSLLSAAGAADVETAALVVGSRLKYGSEDVQQVIDQLAREKPHLFSEVLQASVPSKTSGIRQKPDGSGLLANAAKKASQTGDAKDVIEYLRVRRQYV